MDYTLNSITPNTKEDDVVLELSLSPSLSQLPTAGLPGPLLSLGKHTEHLSKYQCSNKQIGDERLKKS